MDRALLPLSLRPSARAASQPQQARAAALRCIYDDPNGPQRRVRAALGVPLALLHTCGPEALQRDFRPDVRPDVFTLWAADGSGIACCPQA